MISSQLSLFVAAAQEGSFSAAGRKLGITSAAVSKGIASLEKQIGVRLFHRSTRQFSLTEDGASLYQQVSPKLAEITQSIERLSEQKQNPKGKIAVNLPDSFGQEMIMPFIPEFLSTYPDIELELTFDDSVLGLIENGYDIGIGNSINQDSRLIARTLYQMQLGIFASKTYIEQHGNPTSIEQLKNYNCIALKSPTAAKPMAWSLVTEGEEHVQIPPQGNLQVSKINAAKYAVEQNIGLAYMGTWHLEQEVKEGSVIPVLPEYWPSAKPVWIYYSSRENLPNKVRVFIDFLLGKFTHL